MVGAGDGVGVGVVFVTAVLTDVVDDWVNADVPASMLPAVNAVSMATVLNFIRYFPGTFPIGLSEPVLRNSPLGFGHLDAVNRVEV